MLLSLIWNTVHLGGNLCTCLEYGTLQHTICMQEATYAPVWNMEHCSTPYAFRRQRMHLFGIWNTAAHHVHEGELVLYVERPLFGIWNTMCMSPLKYKAAINMDH